MNKNPKKEEVEIPDRIQPGHPNAPRPIESPGSHEIPLESPISESEQPMKLPPEKTA